MSVFNFFRKDKKSIQKKIYQVPKTKEDLKEKFYTFGLKNMWEKVDPYVCSSIRISLSLEEENEIKIGYSKIGGNPDFPETFKWPLRGERPLSFVHK